MIEKNCNTFKREVHYSVISLTNIKILSVMTLDCYIGIVLLVFVVACIEKEPIY